MTNKQKFNAFTLAEVLVTLGVIGVVAAITMPMLITNINERVNSERHANIAYKMTQAMEQMRAHGKLVQYASTSDFVDELQKYLKITKRCDADHIAECWPTSTVLDASGNEYDVSTCKTRKHLLSGSDSTDNNVGLVLADGASIILTYDTSASPMDVGDKVIASKRNLPVGKGKTREFAYTTSVTGPIDFVTDVNGKKGPNSETRESKYYDIRNFKLASFVTPAPACTGENGTAGCVVFAAGGGEYDSINCRSSNSSSEDYTKYCGPHPSNGSKDYWAGAKKLCAEAGMTLPDEDTLYNIYTAWSTNNQYQTVLAGAGSYYFWSSTENSTNSQDIARGVSFGNGTRFNNYKGIYGNIDYGSSGHAVLCVK